MYEKSTYSKREASHFISIKVLSGDNHVFQNPVQINEKWKSLQMDLNEIFNSINRQRYA